MRPLNLSEVLSFLRRHARAMALWAVGFAVAGYLVSFLIPSVYQASAVILPPDEDELVSALSMSRRALGGFASLGRLGGQYFTEADIALATLKSRTVHEVLVDSFDLREVYGEKRKEDAVRTLRQKSAIRIATDGTIGVTVEDRTPERAAQLANAFISELDELNRTLRAARARRTRQFLEFRVAQTDSLLRDYEHQLARYQGRRGTVLVTPEARAAADAAAGIMSQKIAAEVELQVLRSFASDRSEEVQRMEARVRELGRQIGDLPATQVGGAELVRRVAIQQQVLAVLSTQLEEARIREVMDTPTVQVLDPAVPPERRVWPRRLYVAAFGLAVGLVVGGLASAGRLAVPRRSG